MSLNRGFVHWKQILHHTCLYTAPSAASCGLYKMCHQWIINMLSEWFLNGSYTCLLAKFVTMAASRRKHDWQIVSDETSEISTKENKHPTREERLAKHNMECEHLIEYLTPHKYPEGLTKNGLGISETKIRLIYWIWLVSSVSKFLPNTIYLYNY